MAGLPLAASGPTILVVVVVVVRLVATGPAQRFLGERRAIGLSWPVFFLFLFFSFYQSQLAGRGPVQAAGLAWPGVVDATSPPGPAQVWTTRRSDKDAVR